MNYIQRGKIFYSTVAPTLETLSKKSIPYAIIKGEVLSVMAYNT